MTTRWLTRDRLEPLALVGAGGFLGAVLRWAVAEALPQSFPWGTLAANVAGAFLLGLLLYEAHLADYLSAEFRLVVGTGFCSSFTTYSTFATEVTSLPPTVAGAYAVLTYALGFAAIGAAGIFARWVA